MKAGRTWRNVELSLDVHHRRLCRGRNREARSLKGPGIFALLTRITVTVSLNDFTSVFILFNATLASEDARST